MIRDEPQTTGTHETHAGVSTALIDTEVPGDRVRAADEPEPGTLVGRYIVLARVGAGGMGVVLAAYDPELDRKVAIKLLHGARSEDEQQALLLEAQALARLSHPNVVTVHDVGTYDRPSTSSGSTVFIAMEFVRGETLRRWVARPRAWPEVLGAMLDVGEGLVAAHAAGLVHGDLKPDNIMVDEDGRVRVMDFGLARAADTHPTPTQSGRQTKHGVGTPAYMSPETHEGREADARSDQFAYCVTLHELLYGSRPHQGDSVAAITAAITLGELRDPPPAARVPAWLRRIVLRGLATDPDRRFHSMRALLDALRADPARARRRTFVAAGAIAIAAGVAAGSAWSRHRESARCRDVDEQLVGAWSATRADAVRSAFAGTGLVYATDAAERVVNELGAWSERWLDANEPLCLAQDGAVPDDLRAAQAVCLAGRRREIGALVDVLAQADATVVEGAIDAVAELPRPERCGDVEWLAAAIKPPDDPATRAAVDDARQRLATARALRVAGKYDAGLREAEAVLALAEAQGYAPLVAEVEVERGRGLDELGRFPEAADCCARAYETALGAGHDEVAARVSTLMVGVQMELGALETAEGWLLHARALSRRLGEPADLASNVLRASGLMRMRKDDTEGARELIEQAFAALGEHPSDLEQASMYSALGSVAFTRNESVEALEHYLAALAAYERAYGPEHPKLVLALSNVASALSKVDDSDGAIAQYERALVISERALGPDHPSTATVLNNMANVLRTRGDFARAKESYRRVIAIREQRLGPEHPQLGSTLANYGLVLADEGDAAAAAAMLERARAILEKSLGPKHSMVARATQMLAQQVAELNDVERAIALLEPACEILRVAQGDANPDAVSCAIQLAELMVRRGDRERARRLTDPALPFLERAGDRPLLARAWMVQAELAWAAGERARALELARAARDRVSTATREDRLFRERAVRWLADHE